MKLKINIKKIIYFLGILGGIILWVLIYSPKIGISPEIVRDRFHNLHYAFNVLNIGTYTADSGQSLLPPNEFYPPIPLSPSAWREPGTPAFIAGSFLLDRAIGGDALDSLFVNGAINMQHSSLKTLQICQIIILFLIGWFGSRIALIISNNYLISLAVYLLVIFDRPLINHSINVGVVEPLHILLCCISAYALIKLNENISWFRIFVAGIPISLLPLVSGLWLSFIPVVLILFMISTFKEYGAKKALIMTLLLTIISIGPSASWMTRNYYHFLRPAISMKGGIVLDVRAEMSRMTPNEYWQSYLYWSGSPALKKIADDYGSTERLVMWGEKSFDRVALNTRIDLVEKIGRASTADKIQQAEAAQKIMDNFFMHLSLSFPIIVRLLSLWFPFGIFFVALIPIFIFKQFRQKQYAPLWVLAPTLYYLLFHALITHGIPRYGTILYPLLISIGVPTIYYLLCRIHSRVKSLFT